MQLDHNNVKRKRKLSVEENNFLRNIINGVNKSKYDLFTPFFVRTNTGIES